MPGDFHVLTGTENGWIGDLQAQIQVASDPNGSKSPQFLQPVFFLDAFAVSLRVFFCWPRPCCGPQEIILALQAAPNMEEFAIVCDDPRPMRRWMFTAWLVLKFGHHQKWWCLQCFQAVNAQPKLLGCQPVTRPLSLVACSFGGAKVKGHGAWKKCSCPSKKP